MPGPVRRFSLTPATTAKTGVFVGVDVAVGISGVGEGASVAVTVAVSIGEAVGVSVESVTTGFDAAVSATRVVAGIRVLPSVDALGVLTQAVTLSTMAKVITRYFHCLWFFSIVQFLSIIKPRWYA